MVQLAKRNNGENLAPRSFMSDFFRDVDRFFENDIMRMPMQWGRQMMGSMPAVNIRDNEKDYAIEVAAPGMTKQDFDINVNEGVLTISSQKETSNTDEQENYTRREYNYSSFSRSFRLPETVNQEDIKARYEEGILHITVPKAQVPEKQKRSINIE